MFAVFFKKIKFKAASVNSKLEFLYLEVGAFRREVCGDSPIIDKWMYALKNLSRLEERPAALCERVFARLFEAAKIAAYTKEERNQYENDMMTENDYRNTIDYRERLQEHDRLREGRRPSGRSCGRTCRRRGQGRSKGHGGSRQEPACVRNACGPGLRFHRTLRGAA